MAEADYSFSKKLDGISMDEGLAKVTDALREHGFGVLTKIDVQQTLEDKLGESFRPYVILGACNPKLAHRALQKEPSIGLLLPCNVVVQESGGGVLVSFADPEAMFKLAPDARFFAQCPNGCQQAQQTQCFDNPGAHQELLLALFIPPQIWSG